MWQILWKFVKQHKKSYMYEKGQVRRLTEITKNRNIYTHFPNENLHPSGQFV
jgi:hypothetical protein